MSDAMKQDIQKLKTDMADVRATEKSIAVALTRIEGKVDGISEQMATQTQLGSLINQIDDFCGIVEASRAERKVLDESFRGIRDTLQTHEARLVSLEPKKS